jgi:energy-coupling factor transporter transmembrane protein EcfT
MMRYDPRTHLLVLLLTSVLSILTAGELQSHLLVLLSAVYLSTNHLTRQALRYIMVYAFLQILLALSFSSGLGTFSLIFYTFAKMIPMGMVGTALLATSPSALLSAYEKIHASKSVLVMLCILIRFFPVLVSEMRTIKDGIRARGIFPRWYSVLQHPVMAYECFFMPLMVRCLKLSSELASSATLRGIDCSNRRTSIHPVGFKAMDGLAGLYTLVGVAIYWVGGHGL